MSLWGRYQAITTKQGNTDPLIDLVAELVGNPYEFVMAMYPWGKAGTILANETGPDKWQRDVLKLMGKAELNGSNLQLAVASGHGVGKSSLVAWLIHYFISTRQSPQVVVTANTGTQLKTKTWRELGKWHQLALNKHWFDWTATSYKLKDKPETHYASAITWSERNTEGFAGAHDKDIMIIFDEASAIIDQVWEVAQGAMTTPGAMWFAFGNPTRSSGRFRECWGKFRHRWATMKVDSRTAKKVNQEEIKEWIKDYGEDSDFVRVRIKGEFPKQAADQFIPTNLVDEAIRYTAKNYDKSLKIMGCDLARFGDDQTVFCIRQGRKVFPLIKYRKLDVPEIVARIVDADKKHKPDLIYVDIGYMPGVYDLLKEKGMQHVRPVSFGSTPILEVERYRNRRTEMWGNVLEWLKEGNVDLPNDTELKSDLVAPTYMLNSKDQIILESKRDMKKRGLASTDCFVAGTQIFTTKGNKPIETIKVGDKVITPFGNRKVLRVIETQFPENELTNNFGLVGKPNHKVFTWTRGWVKLKDLNPDDKVEEATLWNILKWRFQSLRFTRGRNIGFKHLVNTISQSKKLMGHDHFIDEFGLITTDQSQMATAFITSMEIGQIILLETWSALKQKIICQCTQNSCTQKVAHTIKKIRSTLSESGIKLLHGTKVKLVATGIKNMVNSVGKAVNPSPQFALSAANNTPLSFPQDHTTVQNHAEPKHTIEKNSKQVSALFAEKNFSNTNIRTSDAVHTPVQTGSKLVTLYNLEVEKDNVYYANGILVENCGDSLALTFAEPVYKQSARAKRHKTKIWKNNVRKRPRTAVGY